MRKESKQREGGTQVIITLVFLASIITYINIFIFFAVAFFYSLSSRLPWPGTGSGPVPVPGPATRLRG